MTVLYVARQEGRHSCDHTSFMFDPPNNLNPILILQDTSYTRRTTSALEACHGSMSAGAGLSYSSLSPSIAFEVVVSEHLQPLSKRQTCGSLQESGS